MEEISYVNFFKFISQQKIRIPLVETAIIQNEQVDSILSIDDQGYVKKKPPLKINSLHYYLQKIMEVHESHNRLHQEKSPKVCYFYKKGSRSLMNELKIKEILAKRAIVNIDLVQPYIRSVSDKDKFLHAKLSYMQNQFMADILYGEIKVTDPIITESVLDIATILIHCIENFTLRRVLQIEIEYLEEHPGSIWLVNVPKCTVVEAKYTFKFPILKESDILTLSKSIPKNLGKSKTPKVLNYSSPTNIYTFRRGQLRNIHSNLDSPIRMTPVSHLPGDELGLNEKPEESKNFSKTEDLTYRSETPQQLKEAESTDQLFIRELLKGFFTLRPEQSAGVAERRTSVRGGADLQKRMMNLRRNNVTIKSFPKLLRRREYDNDFIECVLKTYFKGKDGNPGIPKEFGIASHVSSEEFTHFLNNNCEIPKEDLHKLRVDTIPEENFLKQPKTPELSYGRKNFGLNLVKDILVNRVNKKEQARKIHNQSRKSFSKKFFDLYLASPILRKKEMSCNKGELW